MIDFIWLGMILISLVYSFFNGNVSSLSVSLFDGAKTAVNLSVTMLGGICFWLGITEIIIKSGLIKKIERILVPVINLLFPKYKNNKSIKEKISLNFTANLLGIGNASTPLAISAIVQMQKEEGIALKNHNMPSREIILFVIINTASLQILPTQMANLRSSFGSVNPFGITIMVWIVSFSVLVFVILLAKILERKNELNR